MTKNKKRCKKCHDLGMYQIYDSGRVRQVFCDCSIGEYEKMRYQAQILSLGMPWMGLPF